MLLRNSPAQLLKNSQHSSGLRGRSVEFPNGGESVISAQFLKPKANLIEERAKR
jgi:hypothetical protein